MARPNGRPRGTYGPIAKALLDAADEPGTVVDLAKRAQVGIKAACCTASRLLSRGELVECEPKGRRPAVLRRYLSAQSSSSLADPLAAWMYSCRAHEDVQAPTQFAQQLSPSALTDGDASLTGGDG